MAQNVTGTINRNVSFTEVAAIGLNAAQQLNLSLVQNFNYQVAGTAAMQVDTPHAKSYVLAATPTTIDLTSLTDPVGNALNFARVRELVITNADTNAAHIVTVYRGASNGWSFLPASTSPITVMPQGAGTIPGQFSLSDPNGTGAGNGYVTGGSSKTITFDPGANTITINVLIVGGSAA